jgi:hypothetical protein
MKARWLWHGASGSGMRNHCRGKEFSGIRNTLRVVEMCVPWPTWPQAILRTRRAQNGHWRLRGGAITLAELLFQFGKDFTIFELMFWYHHADKIVKKRPHAWGSQEVRDAANERKKTYGRYGQWH